MKKKMLWTIVTAGTLAAPLAAYAAPVTYDFTGSGTLCRFTGTGSAMTCTYGETFTGSVMVDVLASGPNGPDGYSGPTVAYDDNGWVDSHFAINWGGNTFGPGPVTGNTLTQHAAWVHDNVSATDGNFYDDMGLRESYAGYQAGVSYFSEADFARSTSDSSWLTGLAFDPQITLAPGTNRITFSNYAYLLNLGSMSYDYTGFNGIIDLGTLSVHGSGGDPTTPVPEPGSFALAGVGVMAAGLFRWRRKAAAKAT
jgi:PEP-CTERM motif